MSQHYVNPEEPIEGSGILPEIETWQDGVWISRCKVCGELDVSGRYIDASQGQCPDCQEDAQRQETEKSGWWYWYCFPGCLPESPEVGPFDTEAEAVEDARDGYE